MAQERALIALAEDWGFDVSHRVCSQEDSQPSLLPIDTSNNLILYTDFLIRHGIFSKKGYFLDFTPLAHRSHPSVSPVYIEKC